MLGTVGALAAHGGEGGPTGCERKADEQQFATATALLGLAATVARILTL